MSHRLISREELKEVKFPNKDVLQSEEERNLRTHDLKSAMAYTNIENDEVGLIIQLADGEQVQYMASLIALAGSLVELQGGFVIPVKAIVRVDI